MSTNYKIQLSNFEGPLDLLLYFIKRDELDIYDIPIAKITEEFLIYIRYIKYLDLELAGEFILTATMLMKIKAQMLLPRHEEELANGEIEDPRTELVQKLLEYKQYKEAAKEFDILFEQNKYVFYRERFEADYTVFENDENYKNATLFDLAKAFKKVLDKYKARHVEHRVELITVSIEEQAENIIESVKTYKKVSFYSLIEKQPRLVIAVTFLAMLDLVRYNKIFIYQSDNFEDIIITDENLITEEEVAA